MMEVPTISDLRSLNVTPMPDLVRVLGYEEEGDGGGGIFMPSTDNYGYDNGGTIIQSTVSGSSYWYVRQFSGPVDVKWFGAKGDGLVVTGAGMTSSSNTLTASHTFTADDVNKDIAVLGAGDSGRLLLTTIASVSGGVATLTHSALATVSGAWAYFGTDATSAIQAAIDWVMYGPNQISSSVTLPKGCPVGGSVYLSPGAYVTTDTIHAGYGFSATSGGSGPTFSGVSIFGDNQWQTNVTGGATLLTLFGDRPAIAVQGARGTQLKDFTIRGINEFHIADNGLGSTAPSIDDVDIDDIDDVSNWLSPSLGGDANGRYSVYAGIAIDPYSGSQPTTAYPTVSFPSWAGSPSQYDKALSSDILIGHVAMRGFVAAVAVKPCDSDLNGDFVKLEHCSLTHCVYIVSVGNSQSRNVDIDACTHANFHTAYTTGLHGTQNGKLGGEIRNCSYGAGIQLLDCPNPSVTGPLTFTQCYSEALWRLGRWGAGVQPSTRLTFQSCQWALNTQSDAKGHPAEVLEAGSIAQITLRDTQFDLFSSVLLLGGNAHSYQVEGLGIHSASTRSNLYEKAASNFLAGGLMFAPSTTYPSRPETFSATLTDLFDLNTNALSSDANAKFIGNTCMGQRAIPICAWSQRTAPRSQHNSPVPNPRVFEGVVSKGSLVDFDLVDTTLTIEFSSRTEGHFAIYGPLPGDVIYDDQSKSVFFVKYRSGNVVKAELQNNYRYNGSTYEHFNDISDTTGYLYFGNARIYMPSHFTQGDVDSSSSTITNVGRSDAYGGHLPTEVVADDWAHVDGPNDLWIGSASAKVSSVATSSPWTITLTGNPSVTETKRRLSFFVRKPPSNV